MNRLQHAARKFESTALVNLPSVCMADRTQIDIYTALGQLRSPFQGLSSWPWLDEALAAESKRPAEFSGREKRERATGDTLNRQGRPYCTMSSPLATEVVERLATDPGGLLWMDEMGCAWAVKLGKASPLDQSQRFGFAITWGGNAILLDHGARDDCGQRLGCRIEASSGDERQAGRHNLARLAQRLRLFNRAEQLLWAIHLSVLRQRRSTVLLPDVLLGQIIWGGNRNNWPRDWRGDIMQTLISLTYLRTEVLRLGGVGWKPRLGAHSVGVTHVELLALTRPQDDFCRPCCPMYDSPSRHGHFLVQIGRGFLGVLEKFMVYDDSNGTRTYDFSKRPEGESGKDLMARQRKGETPSVNIVVKLLGPSRWSGLSPEHRRIVQALTEEITRAQESRRPDKAFVLQSNLVPGVTPGSEVSCTLLKTEGNYVAFNGNGRRRGAGYRIIGEAGKGWLAKCGYTLPDGGDSDGMAKVVRRFLAALDDVSKIMGLVVAAIHPKTTEWCDMERMKEIARRRRGWEQLDPLHLRVYGPEDYLERGRDYFDRKGGFTEGEPEGETAVKPRGNRGIAAMGMTLADRMRRAGIRHEDMAEHLRRSRSFVSRILNGRKPWPPGMKERAEAYVQEAENQAEESPLE